MKKIGVLFVLILLLSSFVIAQNHETNDPIGEKQKEIDKEKADTNIIKTKTNEAFNKEIIVPEWAQIWSRVVFGVKDDLVLSELIVLLMIWLLLFLMIKNTLGFFPMFNEVSQWIASLAITILFAITGTVKFLSNFFFGFGNFFKFTEEWEVGKLVFTIISIIILFFLIAKVESIFKEKNEDARIQQSAREAGGALNALKTFFRSSQD